MEYPIRNVKPQIFFFIGTVAELIKLFPIMIELKKKSIHFKLIASGQNNISTSEILNIFELGDVYITLSNEIRNKSARKLLFWFLKTYRGALNKLSSEISEGDIVLIHGDTISTVMGALFSNKFKAHLVHVEAGLRSNNFLNPFPEEIDRVLATRYVNMAFCPNEWALGNLANKTKMVKYSTGYNTLVDALRYALLVPVKTDLTDMLKEMSYFIFVMHRNENLVDRSLVESILKIVEEESMNRKCLFILHSITETVLEKYGILNRIRNSPNIILTARLGYCEMMNVLNGCQFILTDGGSNQEECFYLGKPCCVLRKTTERIEGLGENVLLSKNDRDEIARFIAEYRSYERSKIEPVVVPSEIIANKLIEYQRSITKTITHPAT